MSPLVWSLFVCISKSYSWSKLCLMLLFKFLMIKRAYLYLKILAFLMRLELFMDALFLNNPNIFEFSDYRHFLTFVSILLTSSETYSNPFTILTIPFPSFSYSIFLSFETFTASTFILSSLSNIHSKLQWVSVCWTSCC